MKRKDNLGLPDNWEEMIHFERCIWLCEHYGTNESDAYGNLIYDVENMPEDVLQAYKDVIESKREAKTQGVMFD